MEYTSRARPREVLNQRGKLLTSNEAARITEWRPGRPGLLAPGGHRPPRHQTGERDDRRRQFRSGDGLRHRPRHRRHQRDDDPDASRIDRHTQYLSRPSRRRARTIDARKRPLLDRLHALELLTGRRPFQGDSRSRSPTSVPGPLAPSTVEESVGPDIGCGRPARAFNKDQGRRYQSAADSADLQAVRLDRLISDAARGTARATRLRGDGH